MREVLLKRGVVHQTKSVACGVRSASRCWVVNISVYYISLQKRGVLFCEEV